MKRAAGGKKDPCGRASKRERVDYYEHEEEEEEEDDDENGAEGKDTTSSNGSARNRKRPHSSGNGGGGGGGADESNVPLYQRLDTQETETLESTSSNTGQSARKRIKVERRAARERRESGRDTAVDKGKDNDWDGDDAEDRGARKKHKNAPAEMRSNRPVRRLRDSGNNTVPKHVDPRFSDLHGKLKPQGFFEAYPFLDKYQEDEISKLGKAMKKTKSPAMREHLKHELGQRKQEMTERRRALNVQERMKAVHAEERVKVAAGKKPFFLKDSAKKALVLEARYDELKQQGRGKLKKFIEKKRIKNAKKDVRWVPEGRRDDGEAY